MEPVQLALAEQQAELSELLAGVDDGGWDRPSRCEGWTVADVLLHLAQTNEMATASARGRFAEAATELWAGPAANVDEGADRMVARDRGGSPAQVIDRWEASVSDLRAALAACDPGARVQWVVGELSARTLATTRLAETWIHTGDVAAALGVDLAASERLWHIARLAWRTLPYAFERAGRELAGPVRFDLHSPAGTMWSFVSDDEPVTCISGDAFELCLLAARRVEPSATAVTGTGPDVGAVLELVRTYA